MIFVDSNVPMYLVGGPHPNRDRAEAFLRDHSGEDYATSAAVYQEILHRYAAIDRRSAAEDAFRLLDAMVRSVFPITRDDIDTARSVAVRYPMVSARDCLHLALMEAHRIHRILTFDRGFSAYPGVTCLPM